MCHGIMLPMRELIGENSTPNYHKISDRKLGSVGFSKPINILYIILILNKGMS